MTTLNQNYKTSCTCMYMQDRVQVLLLGQITLIQAKLSAFRSIKMRENFRIVVLYID